MAKPLPDLISVEDCHGFYKAVQSDGSRILWFSYREIETFCRTKNRPDLIPPKPKSWRDACPHNIK